MGMFDGAFSFSDPNSMALLGMLSGLGQASAASRLPVTFGSALGSLAGGAMQGSMLGQEAQLKGQEAFGKQLQNTQAIDNLRLMALGYGLPAPTMADIQSGKYQGLFSGGLPKSLTEGLQTPITQPAAPAAIPGAGASLAPGFERSATGNLTFNGRPPDTTLSGGRAAWLDQPGVGGALPRAAAVYAQKNGVDPDFYTSVIDAESSFNPIARNPTPVGKEHATGIAQFLPSTAKQYGVDPLNPEQSLDGGARYYADLLKQSGGDYIKAAQAYGTLPKDLGTSLNSKQQKVLQVAQALNSGQSSFTDAGPAQAAQPQTVQAQQPQGNAMFAPDTLRAMLNANIKRYMGYQLTPIEQNLLAASMAPSGSLQQSLSYSGALNAAGVHPFLGGERPGVPIRQFNPKTGQYELAGLNPVAPAGSAYIPDANGGLGGIVQIPGATAAERAFAVAKKLPETPVGAELQQGPQGLTMGVVPGAPQAISTGAFSQDLGKAQLDPHTYYGAYGQPYTGTRAQLGNMAPGGGAMLPGMSIQPPAAGIAPTSTGPGPQGQRVESAAPTFPVQTPAGPKDISQVSVADLFPGGQGIPAPPTPPGGAGYGPPSEQQKDIQKADATRLEGYQKEASENQKVYQDLAHLHDVLGRGLTTGKLTPLWTDLTNVAHQLGVDSLVPKNYDPADAAVFNKTATDLIFAAVKKLQGQVRVAEIEGYRQASPNLTMPMEANYSIITDLLAAGKWQDARAKLAGEYITQTGGAPLYAFDAKFNQAAPLADITEAVKQRMRTAGAKFPGDQPSNQAPLPPPEDRRVIGGKTYIKQGGQWFRQD
jgi:hypothetical protein